MKKKKTRKKKTKWEKRYGKIMDQRITQSTRKNYDRSIAYFWAWVQIVIGRRRCRYPISVDIILQFVIDHFEGLSPYIIHRLSLRGFKILRPALSPSSIKNILCAISVAHREAGKPSSVNTPEVRELMKTIRKLAAGRQTNKKDAITGEILQRMVATCTDGLHGIRDKAILLVAFGSGGRRRSEIANFQFEDLRESEDGYMLRLRKNKTDQEGEGHDVPVFGKAAKALDEWLKVSNVRSGYLFRAISNVGEIADDISDKAIARLVEKRIKLIGLDPKRLSPHSLRSGFMTQSGIDGVPLKDAMQMSLHSTFDIAAGYYREGMLTKNPASRLVDNLDV